MKLHLPMHTPMQPRWQRLAASALLASALWGTAAHAETLEGVLERGARHSVLWFASPESGDLIGQVFANTSQAGQVILASCLPGMACAVEGTRTEEPDESLVGQLNFAEQPSGWSHILQAGSAFMQPALPMSERELQTRFGPLQITDGNWLVFKGSPVLDSAVQAAPLPVALPAIEPAAATTAQPALLARVQSWWNTLWRKIRHQLLALLGRSPADAADPAQAPRTPAAVQTAPQAAPSAAPVNRGTVQVVQGNGALHLVAHFELPDQDIVLLQSTGGTACPAQYRFATLTQQGIAVTPEFGTCSDIASIALPEPQAGNAPAPVVSIVGSAGPSESEAAQRRAASRLHRFALRQGQVVELEQDSPP